MSRIVGTSRLCGAATASHIMQEEQLPWLHLSKFPSLATRGEVPVDRAQSEISLLVDVTQSQHQQYVQWKIRILGVMRVKQRRFSVIPKLFFCWTSSFGVRTLHSCLQVLASSNGLDYNSSEVLRHHRSSRYYHIKIYRNDPRVVVALHAKRH